MRIRIQFKNYPEFSAKLLSKFDKNYNSIFFFFKFFTLGSENECGSMRNRIHISACGYADLRMRYNNNNNNNNNNNSLLPPYMVTIVKLNEISLIYIADPDKNLHLAPCGSRFGGGGNLPLKIANDSFKCKRRKLGERKVTYIAMLHRCST